MTARIIIFTTVIVPPAPIASALSSINVNSALNAINEVAGLNGVLHDFLTAPEGFTIKGLAAARVHTLQVSDALMRAQSHLKGKELAGKEDEG